MKVSAIDTAAEILSGIRLNRISDKDVKSALLKDYLALRKVAKDAELQKMALIDKFREDWKEELPAIKAFRDHNKPVVGHLDYLEAERDVNEAVRNIYAADAVVELKPVKVTDMMDFSEDVTLEQVAFLVEAGVLEE